MNKKQEKEKKENNNKNNNKYYHHLPWNSSSRMKWIGRGRGRGRGCEFALEGKTGMRRRVLWSGERIGVVELWSWLHMYM